MAHLAHADDSQAVTFAREAGFVAGAAQACGQPIGLMTSRTDEVIAVLATSPADATAASSAYKRAMQNSANSQTLSQQLTCPKVVKDYLTLPILQKDYEDNVINKLKSSTSSTPVASTTAATTPNSQPAMASAVPTAPTLPLSATTTTNPVAQTIQTTATNPPLTYHLPPTDVSAPATTSANGPASVPLQQVVTGSAPATVPFDSGAAPSLPNVNTANLTDAQRVQMAQKLTDMAASLLNSTQPAQFSNSYSQNVTNQQLNGVGANNPAFSNSLGVQPYPAGQTSNAAIAASGDPGLQPYPAASATIPQSNVP